MQAQHENGASVPGTALAKTPPPKSKETLTAHPVQEPLLSVEDRIKRIELMSENIRRRKVLKEHLEKIENLRFGDFDEKSILILQNGNNEQYVIKSGGLCAKVALLCKEEMANRIAEIEEEIMV